MLFLPSFCLPLCPCGKGFDVLRKIANRIGITCQGITWEMRSLGWMSGWQAQMSFGR
jgi:hypothetical protein